MPEIRLDRTGVVAIVGELITARMPEQDHAKKPSPNRTGQRQIFLKGSGGIAV